MDYYSMENGGNYNILRPYLTANESVLWVGSPCTTRKNKANVYALCFMLFWTGFAIFWTVTALASGGGLFGLFGVPFMAVGFYMLYTILTGSKKKLSRTVYAVTDARAIILIPSKNGYDMASYLFSSMQGVNISDLQDNSGTIVFQTGFQLPYYDGYRYERSVRLGDVSVPKDRFLLIDGVNEVYNLIMDQINAQQK